MSAVEKYNPTSEYPAPTEVVWKDGPAAAHGMEESFQIIPNVFYKPAHIRAKLGTRCLNQLTKVGGLRAVGGWYSGEVILECFRRIWQTKTCQRESAGKEVPNEAEHAKETETRMEKGRSNSKSHSVPKRRNADTLLGQMAEVGE